jgi:hypothetical protein
VVLAASLPDWLTAIGGFGAFVATGVLAFLARKQMTAAQDQVTIMRKASADEAKTVREQIDASIEQGTAIREAARAQLQPMVFAHPTQVWLRGPDDALKLDLQAGQVAFPYYLANEGTGIALNIRHGVELDGDDEEFGEGSELRVLRPSETVPIRDPTSGQLLQIRPLAIVKAEHELRSEWEKRTRRYWVRFENVFGERFETRNPFEPQESATFTRLPGSAAGPNPP